jgi:7,8-dihydro-6-hydroxymethylpterin dimethyltransferase
MVHRCPHCGDRESIISSDARFYWKSVGDSSNSCCGGGSCCSAEGSQVGTLGGNAAGRQGGPFETLKTCLALIEVVDSCNLSCPTCYAASPVGTGHAIKAPTLENLQNRIQGIIDRKGPIEILQLSGGEPTIHPQFFELLRWVRRHPNIGYVLVNTNGVRLAGEDAFLAEFEEVYRQFDNIQLYLQFDGIQAEGQEELRGADFRKMRHRAIERCGRFNLPITLACTVTPENIPHLWETVQYGLKFPHVRGVSFQPLFGRGRVPMAAKERGHPLNTADVLLSVIGGSKGEMSEKDFTPLPCGDPNCATTGYMLRFAGQVHSVSKFIDFSRVQGFLKDKLHYTLEDLAKCGCDNQELGDMLRALEIGGALKDVPFESIAFRILVKPFMDEYTWDQDRIDRCCTHVIRPDGKLDSFCRYYSGFVDAKVAP